MNWDPIELEIFHQLLAAIPEEMGALLERGAYSANIKERRDFSCALFDQTGAMIAQAAHIPVHLGAMPMSVQAAISQIKPEDGDLIILNDPYGGGTHLPDITMISPVSHHERIIAYAANRAHHSDVGGMAPGSMPLAREIHQEGLILPPLRLIKGGVVNHDLLKLILANTRTPKERLGDLRAQHAANDLGIRRYLALIERYGLAALLHQQTGLMDYGERMMRAAIERLPDGEYQAVDHLDDDGIDEGPIEIRVRITVEGDRLAVDFTGSAGQVKGAVNAVEAVTVSAVHYAIKSALGAEIPPSAGCFRPVEVIAPLGSIVNARFPAATVGGNVETSQRIVDAVFLALAEALPERIPAASCGSMNNLSIGGLDDGRPFSYYETIGGGMGGRPGAPGLNAVHTHMTNTRNTPVEAIEFSMPLRVRRYQIRQDSGGAGRYPGGDGIIRDIETLVPAHATILSERRNHAPYGLRGGHAGQPGQNQILRGERALPIPGKADVSLNPGDRLIIATPGGGGWGEPE